MKNKGFTLVEIMAVLIIMGVLLLVTLPSVFNSLDNKKKREHDKIVDEIKSAAELYVTQNKNVQEHIETNGTNSIDISYATLVTEGLINGNEIDPLTSEPWNTVSYVKIKKESGSMSIISEYHEGEPEPSISFSAINQTLSTRENYFVDKLLENVIAKDANGIDYKNSITYTCQLNKSGDYTRENCKKMKETIGTHQIKYTLIINETTYTKTADITIE